MSGSQAKWSADGSYIHPLDTHTKAKHQILEEYIENLIITLYGKGRYGETTFTFIDGFCGGGMYDDKDNNTEWQGSPLRIIKAVREGYKKSRRQYPLNVNFIFIDNKQDHLDCLRNYSMPKAGFGNLVDSLSHEFKCDEFESLLVEKCEFRCGEFEDLVNWCVFTVSARKGHSFFLLDPFGWTDISMASIRLINSITGSEILYTYMIRDLKRFVIGKHGRDTATFNRILEADGYYESVNLKSLDEPAEQRYLRNESLRLFREKGKAKYAHTFSLIPKGYIVVIYYLMHFSQNLTALQVMKDTLWKYNNLCHLFEFEVYGFGLKTVDHYKQSPKLDFYIEGTIDSHNACIETLDREIGQLIRSNYEGTQFRQICNDTMQQNPANKKHYEYYFNRLRRDKEIEVVRKGKIIRGEKIELQNSDIIRGTGNKQIYLF
ncbi:three-Cys-motif partner protein TcmP [Trichocoleus sp. Lan]|uniref:three-Cys-motif partner protein TcmP n=1 Tax=Trichocoleus sp. Lan TaxID=2933927 RepID=UPI00329926D7